MDAVQIKIHGIKCDAEGCDYTNDDVTADNYAEWIDRPCPKCGANLLTKEDYAASKMIEAFGDFLNSLVGPITEEQAQGGATFRMSFNGSGIPTFIEESESNE